MPKNVLNPSNFFNPDTQENFPEGDFWMCIKYDLLPYVLQIEKDEIGFVTEKMTEAAYKECAAKLNGIISMIRVEG